jgi:hypothetical protein
MRLLHFLFGPRIISGLVKKAMATEAAGTSQPAGRPEAYPVPAKVEEWKSIPSFLPQPPSIIRALAECVAGELNIASKNTPPTASFLAPCPPVSIHAASSLQNCDAAFTARI